MVASDTWPDLSQALWRQTSPHGWLNLSLDNSFVECWNFLAVLSLMAGHSPLWCSNKEAS